MSLYINLINCYIAAVVFKMSQFMIITINTIYKIS